MQFELSLLLITIVNLLLKSSQYLRLKIENPFDYVNFPNKKPIR